MKDLYSAYLLVNRFRHYNYFYDGLKIHLIRDLESESIYSEAEYAEMIEDYNEPDDPGLPGRRLYPKSLIDELFTVEEIEELRDYFGKQLDPDEAFMVEKVELPIPLNMMGFGAIPVGGNNDILMFSKRKDYPLKFKVSGYFDIDQVDTEAYGFKAEWMQAARARLEVLEQTFQEKEGIHCQIPDCKNLASVCDRMIVDRNCFGLPGNEGCSITIFTVGVCKDHSFKTNREALNQFLDGEMERLGWRRKV